jgi:uncharacterized RDD family membrane protein YckC
MRKSKKPHVTTPRKKNRAGAKVSAGKSHQNGTQDSAIKTATEMVAVEAMSSASAKPTTLKKVKADKERLFNPHETARVDSLAGSRLATFKQRLVAYAIDALIVLIFSTMAVAFISHLVLDVWHVPGTFMHITRGGHPIEGKLEMEKTNEFFWVIFVLLYFGLTVWLTNGLTLGKRIMKIRVVSLTHERITLWQSVERAFGYGASALEAGFGFFQFFIYPNRTCVHDRIAETIVVKDPRVKKEKST